MKKMLLFLCIVETLLLGMEQGTLQRIQDPVPDTTVSFVYYPTTHEVPLGHAELEVEGNFWTLVTGHSYGKRSAKDAIAKTQNNGLPFFRFILKADAEQIRIIKESIHEERCMIICSRAALHPLGQAGVCSVPFPINISPLATATYLKIGTLCKLNNVQKIEYYGNRSTATRVKNMLLGPTFEIVSIAGVAYLLYIHCLLWATVAGLHA
ncbi:MAG: hypothetical protein WCE21_04885 [Candidatus Babeliales bacterium]